MTGRRKTRAVKALLPPDWSVGTLSGRIPPLEEIPEPRVRFFPTPDRRPREVSIKIHSWRGVVPGAKHFYADVWLEPNPVWDGRADKFSPKGVWLMHPDDAQTEFERECPKRGRSSSKARTLQWVDAVVKRWFDGWKITIQDFTEDVDDRTFVYAREGD